MEVVAAERVAVAADAERLEVEAAAERVVADVDAAERPDADAERETAVV